MKRRDLIKAIEKLGCVLIRHGGKHDWYRNPATGVAQPVPRHREIDENKRGCKAIVFDNPLAFWRQSKRWVDWPSEEKLQPAHEAREPKGQKVAAGR